MRRRILCLGATPTVQRTLSFARVTSGAVNRADDVRQTASGKSVNVARTLYTLGYPATALGFLGGISGDCVRRDLNAANVDHDFLNVAPATRTCTTVIDRATATVTELVEESAAVDVADYDRLLDCLARHLAKLDGAAVLVLSGSLTPGAPPDFYARCIRAAGSVPVILDTRGLPLARALGERPALVKPNLVELEETLGYSVEGDEALRDAIRALLDRGPRAAIITRGAAGAIASDGTHFWKIHPPAVAAINPIGSGDALAAGVAARLADTPPGVEPDWAETFRLGAACGTANALNSPAGHARRGNVERLLPQVRVEPF